MKSIAYKIILLLTLVIGFTLSGYSYNLPKYDFCHNGFDRDEAERSGVPTNVGNGTTSEYIYDGVGKRIQSIDGGIVTKYLYDGLNVIIERDGLNNTLVTYTRGLSYGGGIGGIISRSSQDAQPPTQYYHYDGIGSVTGLTDSTGKTVQTYTYDAYGNILKQTGLASTNSYQFSTKEYSIKSGLTYFGMRYYDPKIGIFITPDPYTYAPDDRRFYTPELEVIFTEQVKRMLIQNGGLLDASHYINLPTLFKTSWHGIILGLGNISPNLLHRYTYCYDNPVNYIDPWGLRGKNWTIIGADATSLGGSLISTFSAGTLFWVGAGISVTASKVSLVATFQDVANKEGTTADALIATQTARATTITALAGLKGGTPVIGSIISLGQLIYDFIAQDP